MSNQTKVRLAHTPLCIHVLCTTNTLNLQIANSAQLNSVIFKDKATAAAGTKFFSLFPGLGYAAGYKVSQRIYKYGGQPIARDYLAAHYGKDFESAFGKKSGKAIMHSTAGR